MALRWWPEEDVAERRWRGRIWTDGVEEEEEAEKRERNADLWD